MIPHPVTPLGGMFPGYISDGLLWHLDALSPMRDGSTGTLSTWQDLSGHGHDVALSSPITFNGFTVPFLSASGRCPTWVARHDLYVELVAAQYKGYVQGNGYSFILALYDNKTEGLNTGHLTLMVLNGESPSIAKTNGSSAENPHDGVYRYKILGLSQTRLNAIALYYSAPKAYLNGKPAACFFQQSSSSQFPTPGSTAEDFINNRAGKGAAPLIASLRVYSRELTEAEMLHNYRIDKQRFNLV